MAVRIGIRTHVHGTRIATHTYHAGLSARGAFFLELLLAALTTRRRLKLDQLMVADISAAFGAACRRHDLIGFHTPGSVVSPTGISGYI